MALIKDREFNQSISLFGLIMLGVGATIGAGIFVLLGEATVMTGPSVVLAFLINFVIAIIIAFHYAEMASLSPIDGGGYSFIEEAFGNSAYFIGWLVWLGNIAYASFCAIAFAIYASVWTGLPIIPLAVATLISFALINLTGVKSVVNVEKALTLALLILFIIFIGWGAPKVDLSNFTDIFPNGAMALLPATSLVFLCFIGFETITTISAEVKKPRTNIPKALILTVIISGLVYVLFAYVFVGMVNYSSIVHPDTALLQFFKTDLMKDLMIIASLLATLSSLNIGLMAASRNAYALARDGFLPKLFSKVSNKDSPYFAIGISSIIACALLLTGQVKQIASVSDFSYMIVVSMVCLSVVALRKKMSGIKRFFKVPLYPYTSFFGVIIPLLLIPFLDNSALLIGAAWIVIGLFFYVVWHSQVLKHLLGKPKKS